MKSSAMIRFLSGVSNAVNLSLVWPRSQARALWETRFPIRKLLVKILA